MNRIIASLCAAVLLAAVSASAWAAPARPERKVFNLKGSDIDGALVKPSGTWIGGTPKDPLPTLIEYRIDFNPEMVKLTEEL